MMNLHRCEYLVRQRDEYTILQIMQTEVFHFCY